MTTNEADILYWRKTADMELSGPYGIPKLRGIRVKNLNKVQLLGFNYATNMSNLEENSNKMVHFFLPDEVIERVWNNPDHYIAVLNQYKAVIQPDFSQYVGMPKAMLIWQHYRRMWLSAYLQQQGLRVIPAPCWSDEDSFEYCFDGMPYDSCLCISTVGCMQNPQVRSRFMRGFEMTLKRLEPSQLILYGKVNSDITSRIDCPYVVIESEMSKRINKWKEEN